MTRLVITCVSQINPASQNVKGELILDTKICLLVMVSPPQPAKTVVERLYVWSGSVKSEKTTGLSQFLLRDHEFIIKKPALKTGRAEFGRVWVFTRQGGPNHRH